MINQGTVAINLADFTEGEIRRIRPALLATREFIGRQLYAPKCDNLDPNYNKERSEGSQQFIRPFYKYFIEVIDVIAVVPVRDMNGDLYIQFNGDPNLRYPVVDTEFPNVTQLSITDALKKWVSEKTVTVYADGKALYKEIAALNINTAKNLEEWVTRLSKMSSAVREINTIQDEKYQEYLRQVDAADAAAEADIEIKAKIEITE